MQRENVSGKSSPSYASQNIRFLRYTKKYFLPMITQENFGLLLKYRQTHNIAYIGYQTSSPVSGYSNYPRNKTYFKFP